MPKARGRQVMSRKHIFPFHAEYAKIIAAFYKFGDRSQALLSVNLSPATFYRRKFITELYIVDPAVYNVTLDLAVENKWTLAKFNDTCKRLLKNMKYCKLIEGLLMDKKILPGYY